MNAEHRRFAIADALILIAGLAAGLGLVRAVDLDVTLRQIWDSLVRPKEGSSSSHSWRHGPRLVSCFRCSGPGRSGDG
jgi:hypothetical protein